jgi:hypothetical protein
MKYIFLLLIAFSLLLTACGGGASTPATSAMKNVATGKAGDLSVAIATESGTLKNGANDLTLTFTDASGKTVDVGAASLNFNMPAMGSMAEMNDAATLTKSATPGVYNGKVKLQMAGDWIAQIAFEGAAGKGKGTINVVAR